MSSETPVVQVKTLPMKYKCMHYALIAFISNHSDLNEETKEIMINKLPLYDNPQTQMEYYTNLVDFKSVDTNIIKPMMKKKKESLKAKVAPKKKNTKKTTDNVIEQTPADAPASAPTPAPKLKPTPKKKDTKKATDSVIDQTTIEPNLQAKEPTPTPEPTPIPEPTPKKKISRKKKETPTPPLTIAVPDDYPDTTLEMVEEDYDECPTKKLPTTPIMKTTPKTPKTPRAPSKKPKNQLLDSPTLNANLEDCLMIKHNEKRYWTLDEQLQNGPLFGDMTDEDGDPAPSSNQVGTIVNGKISLV